MSSIRGAIVVSIGFGSASGEHQFFPSNQLPLAGRKGGYCKTGHEKGAKSAKTLVIGDSYAEFSSDWPGSNIKYAESYFDRYCDDDWRVCNMGVSGTTSAVLPGDDWNRFWSWAYPGDKPTGQLGLVEKSFAEAPEATRVIYYISGNDFMDMGCTLKTEDVQSRIEQSLKLVVETAKEQNHIDPENITMIGYATPQAHFADPFGNFNSTAPDNYVWDESHFSHENIVEKVATKGWGGVLPWPMDAKLVVGITPKDGEYTEIGADKTVESAVNHFCEQTDTTYHCAGAKFTWMGGICPPPKSWDSSQNYEQHIMDTILGGIRAACKTFNVNFVDVHNVVPGTSDGQWSPTDSDDQKKAYHRDDIHLNMRGNCAVTQHADFERVFGECKLKKHWDCTQYGDLTEKNRSEALRSASSQPENL